MQLLGGSCECFFFSLLMIVSVCQLPALEKLVNGPCHINCLDIIYFSGLMVN